MPWSSPQRSSFDGAPFSSAAAHPKQQAARQHTSQRADHSTAKPTVSPQAMAIEALKQRSGASGASGAQSTQASNRANELVSQEIYRMEVHAQNINERSQQQANEILALKRSAQQAAIALRRQGIHSHPQLDTITKFLEHYPSTAVPHLERDTQGHFVLGHTTVNLNHAEQEAQITADALRNRTAAASLSYPDSLEKDTHTVSSPQSPFSQAPFSQTPFSQAVSAGPSMDDYLGSVDRYLEGNTTDRLAQTRTNDRAGRKSKPWNLNLGKLFSRMKRKPPTGSAPSNRRFSLLDGAIWFSGAAIARIMIEGIVLSYPILRMPLLLILFCAISFAIYRVVVSKSSDLTSAYRLGITLLGLFLGSSL